MNHSCPEREQLRQLLCEQLDAARRAALEAHVETCPACQEALARLSDEVAPWPTPPTVGPPPEPFAESVREVVAYLERHPPRPAEPALAPLRYQLLRLHARGGLGEVHVAEDEELHRPVAVKRLQDQHARRAASRARFLREAAITGRLEHPGVVPIHGLMQDADGRPCYAMRFVEGESLKEAIGRFHAAGTAADPGLALRQLLGRFVAACNTVAYAHSRGVVHRDLKPANILLGPYGETLVVDWGLAKRLDQAEPTAGEEAAEAGADGTATQLGQAMGTPAYMSPEQAEGRWDRVGPASDIYGLGATLYCLLTGRAPYDGTTVEDVLARVRRGEFARPRLVQPTVPPALEAVCLKALAWRPEGRYPSAQALAEEVERWLADEPVAAYPESTRQRWRRWRRRHRTWVVGAGVLVGCAFVALLAGTLLLAEANRRTHAQWERAEAHRVKAEAAEATAKAINKFLTENLLAVAQPGKLGRQVTVREALDAAVPKLDAAFAGQPEVEASVRRTVGTTYHELGMYPEAEPQLRKALAIDQDLFGIEHPETLAVLHQLARLLLHQGKIDEAEPYFRQHLDVCQRVLDPDHPETLRARQSLAGLLKERGQWTEAEALYRQSLEAHRRVLGPDHPLTLAVANGRAVLLTVRDGQDDALFRQNLDATRRVLGPDHPETLTAVLNLALALGARGNWTEAEALYQQGLETSRRVLGPEHPETVRFVHNLAKLRHEQGRLAEAEGLFREAVRLRRKALPQRHVRISRSLLGLAQVLTDNGRAPEAEELLREVREIRSRLPKGDWRIAEADNALGACLTALGRYAEAEALLRNSYESLKASSTGLPAHLRLARARIIRLYEAWGQPEKAAAWRAQPDPTSRQAEKVVSK